MASLKRFFSHSRLIASVNLLSLQRLFIRPSSLPWDLTIFVWLCREGVDEEDDDTVLRRDRGCPLMSRLITVGVGWLLCFGQIGRAHV